MYSPRIGELVVDPRLVIELMRLLAVKRPLVRVLDRTWMRVQGPSQGRLLGCFRGHRVTPVLPIIAEALWVGSRK